MTYFLFKDKRFHEQILTIIDRILRIKFPIAVCKMAAILIQLYVVVWLNDVAHNEMFHASPMNVYVRKSNLSVVPLNVW